MREDDVPSFGTFLVEDVILTLGNLRGAFAWLAQPGVEPAQFQAALRRLDRQIELLEDRARAVCRPAVPPIPDPSPAAYVETPGVTLAALLAEAGDDSAPGAAHFRSRRAHWP